MWVAVGVTVALLILVGALVWSARKRGVSDAERKVLVKGAEAHALMDDEVARREGHDLLDDRSILKQLQRRLRRRS